MIRKGSLIKLLEDTQTITKSKPDKSKTKKEKHHKKAKLAPEKLNGGEQYDYEEPFSLEFSEVDYPTESISLSSVAGANTPPITSIIPELSEESENITSQQEETQTEESAQESPEYKHNGNEQYPTEKDKVSEVIVQDKNQMVKESEIKAGEESAKDQVTIDRNTDFESDIKKILGQARKKKAEESEEEPLSKRKAKKPEPEEKEKKDEHAIFDKIAQSMQMANSYDLGTVLLENRLDEFDKELEMETLKKQQGKKEVIDYIEKKDVITKEAEVKQEQVKKNLDSFEYLKEKEESKLLSKSKGVSTLGSEQVANVATDEDDDLGEPVSESTSATVPAHCPVNSSTTAGTTNFTIEEFRCRDGSLPPDELKGNVQELMEQLEVLRAEVGGKPITINSGYRTPSYNATLDGASAQSRHLCGQAADIRVSEMTPSQVHAKIEELIANGSMKQGGLGLYDTFVHYDTRGYKARW